MLCDCASIVGREKRSSSDLDLNYCINEKEASAR